MQYPSEPHDSEVSFHCHIEILGKLMPAILFKPCVHTIQINEQLSTMTDKFVYITPSVINCEKQSILYYNFFSL